MGQRPRRSTFNPVSCELSRALTVDKQSCMTSTVAEMPLRTSLILTLMGKKSTVSSRNAVFVPHSVQGGAVFKVFFDGLRFGSDHFTAF